MRHDEEEHKDEKEEEEGEEGRADFVVRRFTRAISL